MAAGGGGDDFCCAAGEELADAADVVVVAVCEDYVVLAVAVGVEGGVGVAGDGVVF